MGDIYSRISMIMQEMPAVGKNQRNAQQGFSFRGIDDVMNALYPLLSKYQVFITPEVIDQTITDRITKSGNAMTSVVAKIKYTFWTTDGSSVSCTVLGEGRDSGDKASPKAMAIGMKYALFQTFCIPTEEMRRSDPDRETVEESVKKPAEELPFSDMPIACEQCGLLIPDMTTGAGKIIPAAKVAEKTKAKFGRCLCADCAGKVK